ncbi:MAG: hypothetical protein OEN56_15640 [Gemmatimonadota bacterium]|nr:hypothetical protein [Gemmatimonadota bacterium]
MKIRNGVLVALACLATPASAQLPQASAAALGLGFNMTASARGFAAVANNPAGLAMANSPGFSLAIPAVAVESGLGPVTLANLVDYENRVVPTSVKDAWLADVTAAGGQSGSVGAGLTPVAFNVGSLGVQISSQIGGEVSLGSDAVKLLLYGNAGRTGAAEDFDLQDSALDGYVVSTAAVAYGFRASPGLHLGVTGKFMVGTGLVVGRDDGTSLTSDPLGADIRFPMLYPTAPNDELNFNNGSGIGLDVGAIWVGPALTIGATIQNLVSTFAWDLQGFSYTPGEAFFDIGDSDSNFDEFPAAGAPSVLLTAADELTMKPVFSAGAEMTLSPVLRLSADIRKRVSGGLSFGPDFHMGVGAELTALSFLPLRAHLAAVSGGAQLGGGASVVLGPVNLSAAGAYRSDDFADAVLGMLTLSFGGN